MLQLAQLRAAPHIVKERLAVKYFSDAHLVDEIIALDDRRKSLTFQFDDTKAKINAASKEIGALMKGGSKDEAELKKVEVETWKKNLQTVHLTEVQLPHLNGLIHC